MLFLHIISMLLLAGYKSLLMTHGNIVSMLDIYSIAYMYILVFILVGEWIYLLSSFSFAKYIVYTSVNNRMRRQRQVICESIRDPCLIVLYLLTNKSAKQHYNHGAAVN